MGMEAPPSLQKLAQQSLLTNLPSPSPPLEDLPQHLFLDLFKEAFVGGHKETLRAMVQGWPFTCLPLGSLIMQSWTFFLHCKSDYDSVLSLLREKKCLEKLRMEVLRALLDGVSLVLAQKARPRCRLQVLDLRDAHGDFWKSGPTALPGAHSPEAVWEEQRARHAPRSLPETPFTLIMDFVVEDKKKLNVFDASILWWAKKRKALLHICCEKLTINSFYFSEIQKVLHGVRLSCIRELEVDALWFRRTMRKFVRYLPKMKNLHIFRFYRLSARMLTSPTQNSWNSRLYARYLGEMKSLQEVYIDDVFFLSGRLHKILRSLTPLKTLSLRSSPLVESDVQHLAQAPSTSQLKHLDLRDISMTGFSPEPLKVLLERVAGTLETLVLERCELTDAQLQALLPALGRCSQLRTFSCCGNPISMGVLKELLGHTARLSRLSQGLYPVPLQSQDGAETSPPAHLRRKIGPVGAKLIGVLKDIKPPHNVRFCTYYCVLCYWCEFHSLEPDGSWTVTGEHRAQSHMLIPHCDCPK